MKTFSLTSKTAREEVPVGKRIWHTLSKGKRSLAYERKRGEPGRWFVREKTRTETGTSMDKRVNTYSIRSLGTADDFSKPDGVTILSFAQAQAKAEGKAADGTALETFTAKTVAAALKAYFEDRRAEGSPEESVRYDEGRAARYILPKLGNLAIADLTTARLKAWRNEAVKLPAIYRGGAERPSTPEQRKATINKAITTLKAALNAAFKNDQSIAKSDAAWRLLESFEETPPKDDRRKDYWLTAEDAKRLINAADKESGFRELLTAALLTGARFGSLRKLRVRDYSHGQLRTILRKGKKGGTREHFIELTAEGRAFFDQLMAGRHADDLLLPRHSVDLDGKTVTRGWEKSEQDRPLRRALEVAKLPHIGIHAMRHTWASLAIMGGVSLSVVAENLGHTDTRMVEKHYGHLARDYKRKVIEQSAPRFGLNKATNVKKLTLSR